MRQTMPAILPSSLAQDGDALQFASEEWRGDKEARGNRPVGVTS